MRTIHTDEITKCIKEMCMQVNVDLSPDVKNALLAGKQKEESPIGKQILEQLEQNLEIAKKSQIPICQDTGMTVVFLRIGQEVHIDGDFLEDAVNEGIRQGYSEGPFVTTVLDGHPTFRLISLYPYCSSFFAVCTKSSAQFVNI